MIKKLHETLVHRHAQKIQLIILLLLAVVIFGRFLNPLSNEIFLAHDETQAARLQQFNVNIQNGNIPPRIAPDFSFGLGYPVFNYYAPFPYWVAQSFQSVGIPLLTALKLTYLLAILVGFTGMFLLLRIFFPFYPSLLGSFLYATSPYLAVDIFVRGNLGETWVFALLPLSLYMILTNTAKRIIWTAVILSFLFTSHNILSFISLGILLVFISLLSYRLRNALTVATALLLSAYFLLPAIVELDSVHAASAAVKTNYTDHFLCLSQVWTSIWGYAGSASGCTADGMSFMLGKIPILLGFSGILLYLYKNYLYKKDRGFKPLNRFIATLLASINAVFPAFNKQEIITSAQLHRVTIFFLFLSIGSLYMTLYASSWIWNIFEPVLALFQFPWRFLIFTLFGISFFSAYLFSNGSKYAQIPATVGMILVIMMIHPKYFAGQMVSYKDFRNEYLSVEYIHHEVAYKVSEYVPRTVAFDAWKAFEKNPKRIDSKAPIVDSKEKDALLVEDKPFSMLFMARSEEPVIAQIHYAPYWKIMVDYMEYIPSKFDVLGRPYIPVSDTAYTSVQITYVQTPIEQLANLLTFLTLIIVTVYTIRQYSPSWSTIIKKT